MAVRMMKKMNLLKLKIQVLGRGGGGGVDYWLVTVKKKNSFKNVYSEILYYY